VLEVEIYKKLPGFTLDTAFTVQTGQVMGILGASGCGKSMTLQCIAGLQKPDRGRIVWNNRVLFDDRARINLSPQKRRVGYLFQNYALFPNMSALQNVEIAAGKTRKEKREQAMRLLRTFHLEDCAHKYPAQLSGGQRQRIALARLLASRPALLLIDEPFSALDDYLRWQLELELADILAEWGAETLFVSHSRDEVYRLCDAVCVLTDGKGRGARPVSELFAKPESMDAARISGCKNFSRMQVLDGQSIHALDWNLQLACAVETQDARFIGVRAHFLKPAPRGETQNVLHCTVKRVVDDVFATIVMLEPSAAQAGVLLRMELPKADWKALGAPTELDVYIAPEAIMLLR
jgi:molybdate transport system ATP-binding protein